MDLIALTVIITVVLTTIFLVAFSFQRFQKKLKINRIGAQGEEDVKLILSRLKKNKYYVINNVMLRHANSRTSQIDHIVVSRKGIFVIETKNYSGVLKGNIEKEWWTHICGRNKHVVYNVVYQNQGHVKALKNSISKELAQELIKDMGRRKFEKFFFSVLVFRDSAVLKLKKPFWSFFRRRRLRFKICRFQNLNQYIKKKYRRNVISKKLYRRLILDIENSNIFSRKNLKEHVKNVKINKK